MTQKVVSVKGLKKSLEVPPEGGGLHHVSQGENPQLGLGSGSAEEEPQRKRRSQGPPAPPPTQENWSGREADTFGARPESFDSLEEEGAGAGKRSRGKKKQARIFSPEEEHGEYGTPGNTPNRSSAGTTSSGEGSGLEAEGRISVDTSSPFFRQKLKRFNMLVAQQPIDVDDLSLFELRRWNSEPNFGRELEERIELRPGSPLREKCLSMEDLILSHDGYPELLILGETVEMDSRQYDVSAEMVAEWKGLYAMEMSRYSFFDELFARGCVVDSMEVPGKADDVKYLVEADRAAFREKVDYARVVFKTKHVYTGNLDDWYFEGEGRYSWIDGTTYQVKLEFRS